MFPFPAWYLQVSASTSHLDCEVSLVLLVVALVVAVAVVVDVVVAVVVALHEPGGQCFVVLRLTAWVMMNEEGLQYVPLNVYMTISGQCDPHYPQCYGKRKL